MALLVALLAIVLLGSLAFVSDIGFAYSNQRRIQTGADASALAVGRRIAVGASGNASCSTIVTAFNTAATRNYAETIFGKNASSAAALAAGAPGFEIACETVGTNPQVLVVRAQGHQDSPAFFGGIFGVSKVNVDQQSRVIVAPLGSAVGLRPFAICRSFADQVQDSPGTTFTVPITNADTGCGSSAGNWGMLDFNGGSNPTSDMKNWILNGYDGEVVPSTIDGDPGFNVNAAEAEMDAMMALKDIVLPVYSSVTGTGSNAKFAITGFISVTPCRYKINSKSGPTSSSVNAGCAPLVSPPSDYIQLKFSAFIPLGDINLNCRLNDATCDNGSRTTTLAD